MNGRLSQHQIDRAHDLLERRATQGLEPEEAAELAALGVEGDYSYDLAAAAVHIASVSPIQLPAHVAARVLATASAVSTNSYVEVSPASAPRATVIPLARRPKVIATVVATLSLAVAAGAVIWAVQQGPGKPIAAAEISPAQARSELLATAPDATTLAWTATSDPNARGATGDVVWSASRQQGYMRFVGLSPNDRAVIQYQLWIFDRDRPEQTPVDGGVFDVPSSGEVIVPIDAKLLVAEPKLFAVTIERPGGVVVSARERIVVTAAPSGVL